VGEGKNLKVKDFPVFTSMAFAGINQLKLPDTVRSRSIPIGLRRRAPDEPVRRWREREADAMAGPIVVKLQSLAIPLAGSLREARPTIPEDLGDRAADGWEGLLAIAEVAGEDWPKRARDAAKALNSVGRGLDATTTGVLLLADIEAIFRERVLDRLSSEELVTALHGVEESDWSWLNKNILARKLKPFGIKPRVVRVGDRTPRGYQLEDFQDAFRRYLQISETTATSATPQVAPTRDVADVADVSPSGGNGEIPAEALQGEEREAYERLTLALSCPGCGGVSGHTLDCPKGSA
jgi:putative DNA primase/helicase